jgi:hypothetical protein
VRDIDGSNNQQRNSVDQFHSGPRCSLALPWQGRPLSHESDAALAGNIPTSLARPRQSPAGPSGPARR